MQDHLEAYERATGKKHPLLVDAPTLPDGCGQLWSDFLDLHADREIGMSGPRRITSGLIDCWQRVHDVRLPSWQVDAIKRADIAFLDSLPKGKRS